MWRVIATGLAVVLHVRDGSSSPARTNTPLLHSLTAVSVDPHRSSLAASNVSFGRVVVDEAHMPGGSATDGPSSLEAYCAQRSPDDKEWTQDSKYVVGQPVMADWMEFGVDYKAIVTGVNPDGTYNVVYDLDGMRERHVKPSAMKPRKVGPKNFDPHKDPACDLKDDVEDLNEDIDTAYEEVARWLANRRKKKKEEAIEEREKRPAVVMKPIAGAPSAVSPAAGPAGASGAAKGARSTPPDGVAPAPAPAIAVASTKGPTLNSVIDCVFDVDNELKIIQDKQVELELKGELDPELKRVIDGAVERRDVFKEKVHKLEEANKAQNAAKRQVQEFKRKSAHVDKAKESEAETREAKAESDLAEADAELEKEAEGLQESLRDVKSSVRTFDTSVHPNGAKWWRFRYEYSYIESFILIMVVPILMFWKKVFEKIRADARSLKEEGSEFELVLGEMESMHLIWLQFAVGELYVCLLVVITVWCLTTFGALDFLKIEDDNMHLPTAAGQYRVMAVNISMQLACAMILYHILVYSVVRSTAEKFRNWNSYEGFAGDASEASALATSSTSTTVAKIRRGATFSGNPTEFDKMKNYFLDVLDKYPNIREKLAECETVDRSFPFGQYLSVNVRLYTDHILELNFGFWFMAWATFLVMMCLHRFYHMAYVRIMGFFAVLLCITFVGMGLLLQHTWSQMERWSSQTEEERRAPKPLSSNSTTERVVSFMVQYGLFFLCYGFVRMVTAPWLWHIYFRNVLILTCVFGALMLIFVVVLAPMIPVFNAAMSVPPNISEKDVDVIVKAMKYEQGLKMSPLKSRGGSMM